MSRTGVLRLVPLLAVVAALVTATQATSQLPSRPAAKPQPRLEPVAETRLLMQGINQANFNGLERILKEKPADVEAWTFARGQALLIAEGGNLLMLRPPKNQGVDAWMDRSQELRDSATALAKAAGNRDYERSRAGLTDLANTCTRCHQTFRVPVRIVPFGEPGERPPPPEKP
jgi:Cytochrome C'